MCKKELLLETLNYFSDYDFLNKYDFIFLINNVDIIIQYYNMMHNDYIIFLPKSAFNITKQIKSSLFCFVNNNIKNKNLKNELEEEDITLIPYEKINEFNYFLNLINKFHKKYVSNDFIEKYIMKIGELLENNKYYLLNNYKPKEYYFYENIFLPNILYKKIKLSHIIQFIPLEHYAYKKSEYLLRSFSQIAEELGAIKINIYNEYKNDNEKIFKLGLINNNITNDNYNKNKNKIKFEFKYSKNNYINLNEFLLNGKILNENKFLLCKEDYESNIELKYLIHARSRNFIEKYYTQFKTSTINNKELNIFLKLKDYNINIENQNIVSEYIETNLQIDFLNILDHTKLIDGSNIYPLKEGYIYLKQIILKDNDYSKYINFLKAHLHGIQNKYIYLAYDYEYSEHIMKIYHQCIELNFKEDEFIKYISKYWENHSEWYHFTLLRDMLLLGNDNLNDKIHFVSFQYMYIFKNKYIILKKIEDYLNNIIDKIIDNHITNSINKYNNDGYNSNDELEKEKYELLKSIENMDDYKMQKNKEKEKDNDYLNKFQNFINENNNNNINDYINYISNALNGYTFLEDSVITENEELEKLYYKYSQYVKYNLFEKNNDNNDDFNNTLFKQKLKNNQFNKKIIEIIIKGIKGSFYYENGISNNIINNNNLSNVINNVINYYFNDELNILQELLLYNMFNAQNYKIIDIKLLIKELLDLICNYYINDFENNIYENNVKKEKRMKSIEPNNKAIHDSIQLHIDDNSSPLIFDKNRRLNIVDDCKNIFIKFINKEVLNENDLLKLINEKFSLNYILTNYRKYRIFYTYDDYLQIIKIYNK